jgi:prevent-host-death family protein
MKGRPGSGAQAAAGSVIQIGTRLAVLLIGLVLMGYLTRRLGTAEYGRYAVAIVLMNWLAIGIAAATRPPTAQSHPRQKNGRRYAVSMLQMAGTLATALASLGNPLESLRRTAPQATWPRSHFHCERTNKVDLVNLLCIMLNMTVIATNEAKTHLSALLERVRRGETVVIARGRKPLAKLIPYEDATRPRPKVGEVMDEPMHVPEEALGPLDAAELKAWGLR